MSENTYKKLEELLEDMDTIKKQLRPWINDTNIFRILSITNQELQHSNFLEFLFSPATSHGLDDKILKKFLVKFYRDNQELMTEIPVLTLFDLMLSDFSDAMVYREYKNIDLFIVSEKNNMTISIENKIKANEADHQLDKYHTYVTGNYPSYTNLFVFLNPDGTEPTREEWGLITYSEVIDILETILAEEELSPKVRFLIDDYVHTLRSDIVMDKELIRICRKIYFEHQEALDLIYETKPDLTSTIKDLIEQALIELAQEDVIIYDESFSIKSKIRFQLKSLNQVFPDFPEGMKSGWKYQKSYFIEIDNRNNLPIATMVSFHSGNDDNVRGDVKGKLAMINVHKKDTNWTWWTVGRSLFRLFSDDYINNLYNYLNDVGEEVVIQEIKEELKQEIAAIEQRFKPIIDLALDHA